MSSSSVKEKLVLILCGLLLCGVLLEVAMRIGGLAISVLQEHRNRLSLKQHGAFRILCLGESTTAWGGKDSYPAQLEGILNRMNLGVNVSVINKGIHANNSARILSELKRNLDTYSPDIVITMMGINDNDNEFIAAYTGVSANKIMVYFKQLRVYRLLQLLRLHAVQKLKEAGVHSAERDVPIRLETLFFPLFLNIHEGLPKGFAEGASPAYREYEECMKSLVSQGTRKTLQERLKETIEAHPGNPWGYLGLGRCYWFQGKRSEAEDLFREAEKRAQKNEWIYFAIAHCYIPLKDYEKNEQIIKKAIEANPGSPWGYVGSGWYYNGRGDYAKAEEMFRKALAIDPANSIAYSLLADSYRSRKLYAEAEDLYAKAIEAQPHQPLGYIELGNYYWAQKKHDKMKEVVQRGVALCAPNDRLYGFLVSYYREAGEYALAEAYAQKADNLRLQYYNPITRYNYQQLREILAARGIKLICMQYPLRNLQALKRMFDSEDGITFVDNESLFRNVLRQGAYSDYFDDIFAGDFGHCSPKGNRLLAENAARVIVKEYFNKDVR
jgi:tetratricopeptide (TPR) repeat protein